MQAFEAALIAGVLGHGRGVLEAAEAALAAPAPSTPPGLVDLLLDGLVTRYTHGYEASVPGLRRALEAIRDQDPHAVDGKPPLAVAGLPRHDDAVGRRGDPPVDQPPCPPRS